MRSSAFRWFFGMVAALAAGSSSAVAGPEATSTSTSTEMRGALAGSGPVDSHQDKSLLQGRLRMIRYLEDYSDVAGTSAIAAFKRASLGGDAFVSTGGQMRFRMEHQSAESLAERASAQRTVAFGRGLLHADFHPGRWGRVFVQLGSHFALGTIGSPSAAEASQLDLQQGFGELRLDLDPLKAALRVGRQEMVLGSGRWVGVRDGTNVRQPFDLARISLSGGGWSNESFFGFVPRRETGVFDDEVDTESSFFGTYWTFMLLPSGGLGFDVAYLGRRRPEARYRDAEGDELRHTWALRLFGMPTETTQVVAHGLVQHGTIRDDSILAFGLSGTVWQRLPGFLSSMEVAPVPEPDLLQRARGHLSDEPRDPSPTPPRILRSPRGRGRGHVVLQGLGRR